MGICWLILEKYSIFNDDAIDLNIHVPDKKE